MPNLRRLFDRFESWLSGWPNSLLTVALISAAVILVLVALRARPRDKAAVLAWTILP